MVLDISSTDPEIGWWANQGILVKITSKPTLCLFLQTEYRAQHRELPSQKEPLRTPTNGSTGGDTKRCWDSETEPEVNILLKWTVGSL